MLYTNKSISELSKMQQRITVESLEETAMLARKIAQNAKIGDVIALTGDLGVGKTTFSQAFINEIMPSETEVTSPTFNLVQDYHGKILVYHFDLYRIENPDELINIGLEDALSEGVCLIEWPEIAYDLFAHYSIDINISYGVHENQRVIVITTKE